VVLAVASVALLVVVAILKPWSHQADETLLASTPSPAAAASASAAPAAPIENVASAAPAAPFDNTAMAPSAGRIVATIPMSALLPPGSGTIDATAGGGGSLWAWGGWDGVVARVDTATNVVTGIRLGIPSVTDLAGPRSGGVAVSGQQVWAIDAAHRGVARIDPARNSIVQRITLWQPGTRADVNSIPRTAWGLAIEGDTLWVPQNLAGPGPACQDPANGTGCNLGVAGVGQLLRVDLGQLLRVDTKQGRVLARIPVDDPVDVVVGFGSVWVVSVGGLNGLYQIVRIDPSTNGVVASVAIPLEPPGWYVGLGHPAAVRASADSIWAVLGDAHAVVRIDPATNRIAAMLTFDRVMSDLAVGDDGAIWVTGADIPPESGPCHGYVARIDPRTNTVVAATPVECPASVTTAAGDVWVASIGGTVALTRLRPAPLVAGP
jgi:hypothetical protein